MPTVRLHPAPVLLAWGVLVIALQSLSVMGLGLATIALLPLPLVFARRRTTVLLRRARWLLLSIVVMFVLATPGQRVPGIVGDIGVTFDGLTLAAEHLLRLTLLLATLALLHERLGTGGMMAGFHWLLAPLSMWHALRERIVVRLMLVIDYVESAPVGNWRQWLSGEASVPEHLNLAVAPLRRLDWAVVVLLGALALAGVWAP